jgi:hypothetical protein
MLNWDLAYSSLAAVSECLCDQQVKLRGHSLTDSDLGEAEGFPLPFKGFFEALRCWRYFLLDQAISTSDFMSSSFCSSASCPVQVQRCLYRISPDVFL